MKPSFENTLLLIIVLLSYIFLAFAYYTTGDLTIRGVILAAIIGTLGIATNWRFGSSKSSAVKDDTIELLQDGTNSTTINTPAVNTENIETVNTNTVNNK
jgi:hypothetical protein